MLKLLLSTLLLSYAFFVNSENVTTTVSKFTYKSCGDSTDLAQNIQIITDPQLPQTDYTLFLDYDLSKEVDGGTSNYKVNLNGIPMAPYSDDLCTEVSKSNITCPIFAGHIASQSQGNIPSGVSGKILLTNEWSNNDGERILCLQFTIVI
jgi:hypothetical protein